MVRLIEIPVEKLAPIVINLKAMNTNAFVCKQLQFMIIDSHIVVINGITILRKINYLHINKMYQGYFF